MVSRETEWRRRWRSKGAGEPRRPRSPPFDASAPSESADGGRRRPGPCCGGNGASCLPRPRYLSSPPPGNSSGARGEHPLGLPKPRASQATGPSGPQGQRGAAAGAIGPCATGASPLGSNPPGRGEASAQATRLVRKCPGRCPPRNVSRETFPPLPVRSDPGGDRPPPCTQSPRRRRRFHGKHSEPKNPKPKPRKTPRLGARKPRQLSPRPTPQAAQPRAHPWSTCRSRPRRAAHPRDRRSPAPPHQGGRRRPR
jgi:hypothetical protein